jgi:hypothetical protein
MQKTTANAKRSAKATAKQTANATTTEKLMRSANEMPTVKDWRTL